MKDAAGGAVADREVTVRLWRELSAPLRRYLRARVGGDAEDLLQEVFVRVHRQLPSLREPSRLQGWVYRIARNAVVDHVRRRRPEEALAVEPEAEGGDALGLDACDLTPTLRRFIEELEPAYREPLVRHEFEGRPLAEVARELGLTESAAKTRVRRARLRLRAMLDACCRFEFDRRGHVLEATPRAVNAAPDPASGTACEACAADGGCG